VVDIKARIARARRLGIKRSTDIIKNKEALANPVEIAGILSDMVTKVSKLDGSLAHVVHEEILKIAIKYNKYSAKSLTHEQNACDGRPFVTDCLVSHTTPTRHLLGSMYDYDVTLESHNATHIANAANAETADAETVSEVDLTVASDQILMMGADSGEQDIFESLVNETITLMDDDIFIVDTEASVDISVPIAPVLLGAPIPPPMASINGNLTQYCEYVVDTYGPEIIEHLHDEMPPSEVCNYVKLCSKSDTIECSMCTFVVDTIETAIIRNTTEAVIISDAENACKVISTENDSILAPYANFTYRIDNMVDTRSTYDVLTDGGSDYLSLAAPPPPSNVNFPLLPILVAVGCFSIMIAAAGYIHARSKINKIKKHRLLDNQQFAVSNNEVLFPQIINPLTEV